MAQTRRTNAVLSAAAFLGVVMMSGPAWAATDDACSLITQAEVTAALGSPVQAGDYVMPTFKKTCTFKFGSGESVTLNIQAQSMFDAGHKNSMGLVEAVPVSGVGDEAYFVTVPPHTWMLARKGSTGLKIAIYSKTLSKDKVEAKEKAMGLVAVPRM